MSDNALLLASDVARMVGDLTPAAIRSASDRGQLKVAERTLSGTRLFRLTDVLEYINRRRARGRRG